MKPKTMILMVVAVACGLVASYLTRQLIRAQGQQTQAEDTVQILVARQKIGPFVPIKEPDKMFTLVDYPERIAPKKALKDFNQVKDKRLNKFLDADKPITEDDLLTADHAGLEGLMKPGQRAVAIKVNAESLVGGFVRPGSRVDVLCTTRGAEAIAKVVLQDMMVLAVDQTSTRNPEQQSILGQTITLAATPQEASRLSLAQAIGELRLTLRGLGDTQPVGKVVARVSDLDKPIYNDDPDRGVDPSFSATASPPVPTTLPALPEEKKPEEPKEPEKPALPERQQVRRHKMKIIQGTQVQTIPFVLGQSEDDDDEDGAGAHPGTRTEPRTEPAAEKKPEPKKPADSQPAPGSAFGGRSTRTGKIQ